METALSVNVLTVSCECKSWSIIDKIEDKSGDCSAFAGALAGRNINNLRYTDDTSLMAESEEELKSLLIKGKEESEKVGFKLNIQKTKIWSHHFMANRWENCGNSDRLYVFGLQNHCRW